MLHVIYYGTMKAGLIGQLLNRSGFQPSPEATGLQPVEHLLQRIAMHIGEEITAGASQFC